MRTKQWLRRGKLHSPICGSFKIMMDLLAVFVSALCSVLVTEKKWLHMVPLSKKPLKN